MAEKYRIGPAVRNNTQNRRRHVHPPHAAKPTSGKNDSATAAWYTGVRNSAAFGHGFQKRHSLMKASSSARPGFSRTNFHALRRKYWSTSYSDIVATRGSAS